MGNLTTPKLVEEESFLEELWNELCKVREQLNQQQPAEKVPYDIGYFARVKNKLELVCEEAKKGVYNNVPKLISDPDIIDYRRNFYKAKDIDKSTKQIDRPFTKFFTEIVPGFRLQEHLRANGEPCNMIYHDREGYDILVILEDEEKKLELTRAIEGRQESWFIDELRQNGAAFSLQERRKDKKTKTFPYVYENEAQKQQFAGLPVAGIDFHKEHFPKFLLKALKGKQKTLEKYDWLMITISMQNWCEDFHETCEYFRELINSEKNLKLPSRLFVFLEDNNSKTIEMQRIWEY